MDITKIRLTNLEALIELYGSATELSKKTSLAPSEISQIRNPEHQRNIGNNKARQIEQELGLEKGWMDSTHTKDGSGIEKFKELDSLSPFSTEIVSMIENYERQGTPIPDDVYQDLIAYLKVRMASATPDKNSPERQKASDRFREIANAAPKAD